MWSYNSNILKLLILKTKLSVKEFAEKQLCMEKESKHKKLEIFTKINFDLFF